MAVKRRYNPLIRKQENRFIFLVIVLLLMLFTSPLMEGSFGVKVIEDVFYLFVIAAGAYAVSRKRRHAVAAAVLGIPFLASIWVSYLVDVPSMQIAGNAFGVALFGFVIANTFRFITSREEVTSDVVYGAVVCYLLIAFLWAILYNTLELIEPGSFKLPAGALSASRYRFIYYSFVTLTTLGYGDISPLSPLAGSLSILEAVIGQLFLVVGVAWLVGMHVSFSEEKRRMKKEHPPSGGDDP